MKTVYLSNNDIIDTINFALYTYLQHYNRIDLNKKHRAVYVIQGKLSEIAVAKYCQIIGIKTSPNLRIDRGTDISDLVIYKKNVAIKSKTFSRVLLPSFNEIYLHIPLYVKTIVQHCTLKSN